MPALLDIVTKALWGDVEKHKEHGFTDVVYKPMKTLLRRGSGELVEQPGIPNSLISAYIELIFGAEAYKRVLDGGDAQVAIAGYRASAVGIGAGTGIVNLAIRTV